MAKPLIYIENGNTMLQEMQNEDMVIREIIWNSVIHNEDMLREYANNMAKIIENVIGNWYVGPFDKFYRTTKQYGKNREHTAYNYWNPVPVYGISYKQPWLSGVALSKSFSADTIDERIDFLSQSIFNDLRRYSIYLQHKFS